LPAWADNGLVAGSSSAQGHPCRVRADHLTPDELAFFSAHLWQILTSCAERGVAEYEKTSWWEFVGAEQRSKSYQKFLADGVKPVA